MACQPSQSAAASVRESRETSSSVPAVCFTRSNRTASHCFHTRIFIDANHLTTWSSSVSTDVATDGLTCFVVMSASKPLASDPRMGLHVVRDCCELAHRVVGCCPYEVGAGGHGRLPVCGCRGSAVPVRALKQARSGADAYCSVLRLLLSTASLAGWASEARWGRPRTRLVDTTAKRTRHAVCVCVCDVINKLLNTSGASRPQNSSGSTIVPHDGATYAG